MTTTLTITEALAEIKTIEKRIEKKMVFINQHLYRQERMKDPLTKDGGQAAMIGQELQSVSDLEMRKIALRLAIQVANLNTQLTVAGITRSVFEWLTWRREVAPLQQAYLHRMAQSIEVARQQVLRQGGAVVTGGEAAKDIDLVINIDEAKLAKQIEQVETALGELDGRLSLINATTSITIA